MAEASDTRLKREIEAIEMLDEEIAGLQQDRRDRMAGLKGMGYDPATVRRVLARRKLTPAERGEADALLDTYEAALGGEAAAVPLRGDALTLATNLLAAELEGLGDPARAQQLVEHVLAVLDIRAEIAVLRAQEKDRKALAGGEGFTPIRIGEVARWYEKCAKHGLATMRLAEEEYRLYRGTVDELGGPRRPETVPTADEKLAALFAKPAPKAPTQRQKALSDAIALARLNKGARR